MAAVHIADAAKVMPTSPFLRGVQETWHARQELRWRVPPETTTAAPVLEQRWSSSLGKEDWRPIPTVVVPTPAPAPAVAAMPPAAKPAAA